MTTYWRIQPAGLGIDHLSEDSNGDYRSLHVFDSVHNAIWCYEGGRKHSVESAYGDEVVKIEAGESWENGDVEGVAIDPATATIVARYTLDDFCKLAMDLICEDYDEDDDLWQQARQFNYDDAEIAE